MITGFSLYISVFPRYRYILAQLFLCFRAKYCAFIQFKTLDFTYDLHKPGKALEETAISELESLISSFEKTVPPESLNKAIPYLALPYLALQEQRREIDILRKKVEGISKQTNKTRAIRTWAALVFCLELRDKCRSSVEIKEQALRQNLQISTEMLEKKELYGRINQMKFKEGFSMALIKCPECGREVSDKAAYCPNCGYPIDLIADDFDNANSVIDAVGSTTSNGRKFTRRKKRTGLIVGISFFVIVLAALSIIVLPRMIHQWEPATCTKLETCIKCGKTRGEVLPHDMLTATCAMRAHCKNCDYETGNLADHTWKDATVSSPKTCSVCGATEGDPLPCVHSFNKENGICTKCGRRQSDCPSSSEKQQIIDFMYECAASYAKSDGSYDPEEHDGHVWADTKKEFPYLSRSDIDEIFFSSENPASGELGEYRRKRWKQRTVEEQTSQDTTAEDSSSKPNELALIVLETVLSENFKNQAHENFYDSEANTYYFNVFMSGSSSLTYTSAFQSAASNFDVLSLTASQELGVDFVASILDGNAVVYSSKNGVGTYGGTVPTKASNPVYSATTGERNALDTAKSYLKYSAFSYTGLIDQLEFEGYSTSEAKYGADNCGADWNEQAVKCAKSYLDTMPFSKQGLIEQLEYEGFTHEQAIYGVEHNGY